MTDEPKKTRAQMRAEKLAATAEFGASSGDRHSIPEPAADMFALPKEGEAPLKPDAADAVTPEKPKLRRRKAAEAEAPMAALEPRAGHHEPPPAEAHEEPKQEVAVQEKAAPSKELVGLAKEINIRFEKAAKLDGQADDHRLSAAIQLAKAKDRCIEEGINFKAWAEENVSQAYETVRKLAMVGSADDPKLALEDMRGKNKAANKALRERKTAAPPAPSPFEPAMPAPEAPAPEPAPAPESVEEALLRTKEEAENWRDAFDTAIATKAQVQTELAEAKRQIETLKAAAEAAPAQEGDDPVENMLAAFSRLKPTHQVRFLMQACDAVGATFTTN